MCAKVSNLKNVHYIVQHKGLATRDPTTTILEIQMLDLLPTNVMKWVGRITNRRNKWK
jgi:hypothetical protein